MASRTLTLAQALERAASAYQAGNLVEAEKISRQILAAKPDSFHAAQLLGACQAALGRSDLAVASYDLALRLRPGQAEAHYNRGAALMALKRHGEALASYDRALELRPNFAEALSNRGVLLHDLKRHGEALTSFERALAAKPDYPDALVNRGVTLQALKRREEALLSYDRALALRPDHAETLNNRGVACYELKRHEEALLSYDRALELRPDYAEALNNRGNSLTELNRLDEALISYDRALKLRPDHTEALYNRGTTLKALKRYEEAVESYDRALEIRPNFAEALNNRGVALHELGRYDEALASCDRALELRPDYAEAYYNRGGTLQAMRRLDEAVASYDRALGLRPDYGDALDNRGVALCALKRFDEALASYDRALSLRPEDAEALNNRGNALQELRRHEEALASYQRALAAKPDHQHAFGGAASCALKLCDWDWRARFAPDLKAHVAGKKSIVSPFVMLGYSDDPALQMQCARSAIDSDIPSPPRPFWTGETWRHDKLRIAYLSADFRAHPVGYLTAGLFERHDRARFEAIGVSFGADDGSQIRKRVVAAFDRYLDVRRMSDRQVAKLLWDERIDIAVDLMGHTTDSRPGILGLRPAPIQVNYLGYPGTTGAPFMDYVMADKVVAPFADQKFYTERIVHLPDCFLVNDRKRPIAERGPTRAEAGLPERGFVFCCFNNSWKFTPEMFDIWMRLLHQVEGSVLWLLCDNEAAERNLREAARRRGIDPSRLVAAGRIPHAEYLARYRLAGLFLDTLPYNAATTASDAFWAGVPVLTSMGGAFAARMAASLLDAAGLPELIAANLEEYEALALRLARDPALLGGIKEKLARHRETYPVFDVPRLARHIEAAYQTMAEIWQSGEAPRSFSVAPQD